MSSVLLVGGLIAGLLERAYSRYSRQALLATWGISAGMLVVQRDLNIHPTGYPTQDAPFLLAIFITIVATCALWFFRANRHQWAMLNVLAGALLFCSVSMSDLSSGMVVILAVASVAILNGSLSGIRNVAWQHSSSILACMLFTTGMLLRQLSEAGHAEQMAHLLIILGAGASFGAFPLPVGRVIGTIRSPIMELVLTTLMPLTVVAVFLFRDIQRHSWKEQDLAILGVLSLFALLGCGIRLYGRLEIDQRCRISLLAIFSHLCIAFVLIGWEQSHAQRTWQTSSNLPMGATLFISTLIIDFIAGLMLLLGSESLQRNQSLAEKKGTATERTFRILFSSIIVFVAAMTLAGIPPLPGFWARFALLSSLMLPHKQSIVTGLSEPHHAFIALSIFYAIALTVLAAGHTRWFLIVLTNHQTKADQATRITETITT